MKYCKKCNVKINTDGDFCPLCYGEIEKIEESGVNLCNDASVIKNEKQRKKILRKIFLMITMVSLTACFFIDVVTGFSGWSILVALSEAYVWALVTHLIISNRSPFEKFFVQILLILAILWYAEFLSKGEWIYQYVYPAVSLGAVATMLMISFISKQRGRLSLSFVFLIFFLAIGSLIILLIQSKNDFRLLNVINIFCCVLSIIGYVVFLGRELYDEICKKFHV